MLLQYLHRSLESCISFMRMNVHSHIEIMVFDFVQCWFHYLNWNQTFNELSCPIIEELLSLSCRVRILCNNCTVLARQQVDCRCCGSRLQGGRTFNYCQWSGVRLSPCLVAWSSSRSCCCPKWQCLDLTCQAGGEGHTKMALSWRGVGGRKRVATRLLNKAVPPVIGHSRRRWLFGILGSRPVFWGCRQS